MAGTLFAIVLAAAPSAMAQTAVWTQRASTGPVARSLHGMDYDSGRGVTVLFAGNAGPSQVSQDTWEWNGTAWLQRSVFGPARYDHAMTYDTARAKSVVFGGTNNGGNVFLDTLTWDGGGAASWTEANQAGPSRTNAGMVYDVNRSVSVLFGGFDGINYFGDTWEFNGTAWTRRSTSGPSPRYRPAIAYDSARGVTVVFGGAGGPSGMTVYGDTWEWNGTVWAQRASTGPSPRAYSAMVYDPALEKTVLFGGATQVFGNGVYTYNSETWAWDGVAGSWTQMTISGPSARVGHAVAYDAGRGVIVLFGGRTSAGLDGQTWELSVPCVAPSITGQPMPGTACPTGSAGFAVIAHGSASLSFQWQVQTAAGAAGWQSMGNDPGPLPCGGGAIAYATPINSPSVTIGIRPCPGDPTLAQHFQIRCVVSGAVGCGSTTSSEATYTICPADFNCSGGVSVQDIFDFLNGWFAGDPAADFDGLGGTSVQDIFVFLNAWFAGCE